MSRAMLRYTQHDQAVPSLRERTSPRPLTSSSNPGSCAPSVDASSWPFIVALVQTLQNVPYNLYNTKNMEQFPRNFLHHSEHTQNNELRTPDTTDTKHCKSDHEGRHAYTSLSRRFSNHRFILASFPW